MFDARQRPGDLSEMFEVQLILTLSLIAGALALDSTAALQLMLSQPLVVGTIAGAAIGDVATGVAIGATLQLVWIGVLPVGSAQLPDASSGSVVAVGATALFLRVGAGTGLSVAAGILLGIITGAVGQRVTAWVRRTNGALALFAQAGAGVGSGRGVAQAVALGLGARFGSAVALSAGALSVAMIAASVTGARGGESFPTMVWAAPLAAAVVAAGGRARGEMIFLLAGFAAGLGIFFWK